MEAGAGAPHWMWNEHARNAEKGVWVDKIHLGKEPKTFLIDEEASRGSSPREAGWNFRCLRLATGFPLLFLLLWSSSL